MSGYASRPNRWGPFMCQRIQIIGPSQADFAAYGEQAQHIKPGTVWILQVNLTRRWYVTFLSTRERVIPMGKW